MSSGPTPISMTTASGQAEARDALARGEFELLYQPIAEAAPPGRVVGFEALARWAHPTRGALEPDAFMGAFEDHDLAVRFGAAILEAALGQMRAWLDAGVEFGRVAVNLSPAQFRLERLAPVILDALARHGVPPERLCVEIMETVRLSRGVAAAVADLRAAGVQIALDDFGAGHASLEQLETFPIDRLKIDRAFCQSQAGLETVRAVTAHAHGLGMRVVVEGVEDAAQLEAVREAGCDFVQGWWIGRPVAASGAPGYLTR